MTTAVISTTLIEELKSFFKKNRKPDLITSYLFYLEKKHHLNPVIFLKEKESTRAKRS